MCYMFVFVALFVCGNSSSSSSMLSKTTANSKRLGLVWLPLRWLSLHPFRGTWKRPLWPQQLWAVTTTRHIASVMNTKDQNLKRPGEEELMQCRCHLVTQLIHLIHVFHIHFIIYMYQFLIWWFQPVHFCHISTSSHLLQIHKLQDPCGDACRSAKLSLSHSRPLAVPSGCAKPSLVREQHTKSSIMCD